MKLCCDSLASLKRYNHVHIIILKSVLLWSHVLRDFPRLCSRSMLTLDKKEKREVKITSATLGECATVPNECHTLVPSCIFLRVGYTSSTEGLPHEHLMCINGTVDSLMDQKAVRSPQVLICCNLFISALGSIQLKNLRKEERCRPAA